MAQRKPDDAQAEGARSGVRGAATLFSDYASVLGARFGSVLLSLISVLMSTRILKPEGYGVIAYFTVIATLIFTVASAWTSTAVARYGREALEERGRMAAVTGSRLVITAPLLVLAIVVVPVLKLAGALPPEFSWAFTALSVALGILWIAWEHVVLLLEAAGRMKLSAVGLLSQQAVVVGALGVIYVTGEGQSPEVIASISVISMAAATVVFGSAVWNVGLWPAAFDRQLLRRITFFSLPMVGFTLSQYVIRSADLVVIRAYGTATDVGVYAVAYQAYTVLQTLAAASPPILTPLFVSLRTAAKEALITRYFERIVPQITFLVAVIIGLGVAFVSTAVPIVFGDEFRGAAHPIAILLIAMILYFASNLYAPIIVLHERTREVGILNIVAAAVNIVGDILFIGPLGMGISGAAVATSIALLIIVGGYFYVARDCVGSTAHPNIFLLLPLALPVAFTLTLSGTAAMLAAIGSAVAAAVLVHALFKPFRLEDRETIAALDMPPRLKRLTLRGLERVAR